MIRRFVKRVLTPPLVILAAAIMFFEEWLWHRVTRGMAVVGRWPVFRQLEAWLQTLPPYGALAILILPGAMLLPIKWAALVLMAQGRIFAGLSVIVVAKVLGTAVVARMFSICREALFQISWVKSLCDGVLRLKDWLYAKIKSMPGWQLAARMKLRLRAWMQTWRKDGLTRRWGAIRRWLTR